MKRAIVGWLMGMMLAGGLFAATGSATTLEELKAQLETLQKKVDELEAEKSREAPAAPQATAASEDENLVVTKGKGGGTFNFHLPWIDTDVRLGGYIKADVVYSDVSAGDNSDSDRYFYPKSIPVGDAADFQTDKIAFTAKQSRLYIKTQTPTDLGDFKTHLEGDFYGSGGNQVVSNSSTWRLRHAYGSLGGLLFGQTWSTFMNAGALPETLDFGGPAGEIFIRQVQLRWTQPFDWGSIQIALENPESYLNPNGSGISSTPDDDRLPDMIGRINYNTPFAKLSLALMGRELRVDTEAVSDSVFTGAGSLAGVVPTFGKDDFRFTVSCGSGLGRYMYTNFSDAAVDPANDELEALDQWGGFVAYRHWWIDTLRSSLVYSYGEADNDTDIVGTSVNKRFQSVHANLIWSPIPSVNLGVEYLYGQRELENDDDGDLNRFQFSAQYLF